MGKGKAQRCPVDGCKFTLVGDNNRTCDKCGVNVCKEHVYPNDHFCQTGKTKGSDPPAPAKQPGAVGFSVVKKEDKKKKDDEGDADPRKDEELLSKLVASKSEALLQEVMQFGASGARYESSTAVQALSNDSKAVRGALSGAVGEGLVEAAEASKNAGKLVALLEAHLRGLKEKGISQVEERRAVGVASLLGLMLERTAAGRARCAEAAGFDALVAASLAACAAVGDKPARQVANEVLGRAARRRFARGADAASCSAQLQRLVAHALGAPEEDASRRNAAAFCVAAVASAAGLERTAGELTALLLPALSQHKETGAVMGAMRVVQQVCKESALLVPHLVRANFVQTCVLDLGEKVAQEGRKLVVKALLAVMERLDPRGVRLVVPVLLQALEEGQPWKAREAGLRALDALAERKASQLFRDLPAIVPAVMECCRDTKKQVAEAAMEALDHLGAMVTNAETIKLLPWLLNALKDPEKVELCLDELMDTTFVNSVDAQSLALIIPVVLRGLRDGTAEVKLKGAITTGNVCSLVADVHDIRPFYGSLIPELAKLKDHSRPRVREHAESAKKSLQEDMALVRRKSSHGADGKNTVPAAAIALINAHRVACEPLVSPENLGAFLSEYVHETLRMFLFDLFEDLDDKMPRNLATAKAVELCEEALLAVLAEVAQAEGPEGTSREQSEAAARAACASAAAAVVRALFLAQGRAHDHSTGGEHDYLVYLPSVILAFASKLLLKRTGLYLESGHRYAVVGMNGVGKTTLLNRIAARDVNGFPDEVSCYYVQHEIMDEDAGLTVQGYMLRDLDSIVNSKKTQSKKKKSKAPKEGIDAAHSQQQQEADPQRLSEVRSALDEVGFTEELRQKEVKSLSGGWRMRLAIARSMLYKAKLLLLDEPTNHLDVAAVDWLRNYLRSLTETTIGLVSHDYEFVDYVATDIIHLADLKLTYYNCGFKDFQKLRPDIVAALPKKENKPLAIESDGSGSGTATPATGGGDGSRPPTPPPDAAAQAATGPSALDLLAAAARGDADAAALVSNIKPILFPEGCKLDGIAHRGKPIAQVEKASYAYPGTEKRVLKNVSVKMSLNSRVALLGPNGAGKSTLLKLLVGELELNPKNGIDAGKLWKHHNLRTAYIAQHSMHHLEEHIEMTPCQYIQKRFWEGQDRENSKMITVHLTEEDRKMMSQTSEICDILSRVQRGKTLFYEVEKTGRGDKRDKDFKSLPDLEKMDKPHVIKLVRLFDEKLKIIASGADLRPLTTPEMIKHLADFGISSELAQRKIRWMSGGQKSRLVLGTAMWTRPHLIVLDEPTNYLDNESLAALTAALKGFRGGVLIISHHEGFVGAIAKELWHMEDDGQGTGRTIRVEVLKKPGDDPDLDLENK